MQDFPFYKYHGTGNDFIIIDNLSNDLLVQFTKDQIAALCHRRFGIGADGLMILQGSDDYDFEMIYYNSDGRISSMCGNGGRCISQLFFALHQDQPQCKFIAIDGEHDAYKIGDRIKLKMQDVKKITCINTTTYELNTGSPHYIQFIEDENLLNEIKTYGKSIRYNETYHIEGINVNRVYPQQGSLKMATYERGVEDETYSCGTGVVAASIANAIKTNRFESTTVLTKGGELEVDFTYNNGVFSDIYLIGPAKLVFKGTFTLS